MLRASFECLVKICETGLDLECNVGYINTAESKRKMGVGFFFQGGKRHQSFSKAQLRNKRFFSVRWFAEIYTYKETRSISSSCKGFIFICRSPIFYPHFKQPVLPKMLSTPVDLSRDIRGPTALSGNSFLGGEIPYLFRKFCTQSVHTQKCLDTDHARQSTTAFHESTPTSQGTQTVYRLYD